MLLERMRDTARSQARMSDVENLLPLITEAKSKGQLCEIKTCVMSNNKSSKHVDSLRILTD